MATSNNQKIENLLQVALDATKEERLQSADLSTGYDIASNRWEVIVKYTNSLQTLTDTYPQIQVTSLLNGYGILLLPEELIEVVAANPIITYMEKPKQLFYEVNNGRRSSCITSLQSENPTGFTGKGTLIAIIDSGIDYLHPDFQNPDGTSRILYLWDQTIAPNPELNYNPPDGYFLGTLFSNETLTQAIQASDNTRRLQLCPSVDYSGHGTHVAGIAAGNGAASNGVYRGVAYEATLIVVKLGSSLTPGIPNTAQFMQAIDFVTRTGNRLNIPYVINLSFGNSYGSHSGTSLLETYLNSISEIGRNNIVIGSGNEGTSGGHTGGTLNPNSNFVQEFTISNYETNLSIQIWKNYWDEIRFRITDPSGRNSINIMPSSGANRYVLNNTLVYVYYGEPSPFSIYQEIYLDFFPNNTYLDEGVWSISLIANQIADGTWDMWMPSGGTRNSATRFLNPTPDITLTIPSTAFRPITVGAYDSNLNSIASFSGRGYTWNTRQVKPDLVAPGVDITSCAPGGGYTIRSGTSMATPFVSGSCAILMQWGIVDGNDPYLYGEKVKAYLISGATSLPAFSEYPNPQTGWGVLCLEDSLP